MQETNRNYPIYPDSIARNPAQTVPKRLAKSSRSETVCPRPYRPTAADRYRLPRSCFSERNRPEQLVTVRQSPLSALFLREKFRIAPNIYLAKFIKQRKPRICLLSANFRYAVRKFVPDFAGILRSVKRFCAPISAVFVAVFAVVNRYRVGVFLCKFFCACCTVCRVLDLNLDIILHTVKVLCTEYVNNLRDLSRLR